jgi:hypothetical protein
MDKVKEVALTISAYIAIPVALCFPVGLFALWLGFIHYYGFQFSTAWQAAIVVDRNIVVGRGASILLIPLIASVLFPGGLAMSSGVGAHGSDGINRGPFVC